MSYGILLFALLFEIHLSNFPASFMNVLNNQIQVAEFAVPRKNSKRNPKDPNMPKRARGSFVLFTKDERPKIQQENPTIKFIDLGAVLGERWRNLSGDERKKYDDLADQDKVRFADEMEAYKSQQSQSQQYLLQQERQAVQEVYFSQEAVSALGKHPQQDIYQQEVVKYEDHNQQQYYIQDPQQLYHQQAVATIQHIQQDPHQMYHPALQGVGDQHELVYKAEDIHLHEPQPYEQLAPPGQVYETDIYKTEHDDHTAYYPP